jgi:hypothetical protein
MIDVEEGEKFKKKERVEFYFKYVEKYSISAEYVQYKRGNLPTNPRVSYKGADDYCIDHL